ncbi:MAG TPA: glycosyltransferase family 4 protein [Oscillatoriaceae cyanobacterium]
MSRPLKILQVCAIDSTAWILLRNQMAAMRDRGWEVHVACADGANLPRLREDGFVTHPIPIARSTNALSHARATLQLAKLIRAERFDVVHVHTPVASLIGRMAAKLAGVPLTVYTAHGFYFHEHMTPAQRGRHVWLERTFGRMTDHLFTQSAEDARTAVEMGIMREGDVTVISNGVLLERFQQVSPAEVAAWRQKLSIPDGLTLVGTVGRVVEEKGYREFFEAAATLVRARDDVGFLVVGSAIQGDRDDFQSEIAGMLGDSRLASRVFFSGFSEDIPALMNLMDVFVLPSYREGMPRSIIEAMAAGRPVVATDIRGCREEVVEGETGYLIPVRDAAALAERIDRLLDDPALRARLGEAGRARAEALFHENMVIERLLGRLEALAQSRGLLDAPVVAG